jgi:imidazole glycerol-phosphate synthase subunit HisF
MLNSQLCKRIIPCLDIANQRTVKGVNFQTLRDAGDPIEQAVNYQEQGADELMFLDILASVEGRQTTVDLVAKIADELSIPFTVGGGISSLADASRLLENGADKISINTAAIIRPALITEIANIFGSQCCVIAIDARKVKSNQDDDKGCKWEILINGGRTATGIDAFEWAKQAIELGAGEVLLTSWDKDGTLSGFDIELTRHFSIQLPVPVIASGGAMGPECFVDVFTLGAANAALAATIFHDGVWTIKGIKEAISPRGISVRLC